MERVRAQSPLSQEALMGGDESGGRGKEDVISGKTSRPKLKPTREKEQYDQYGFIVESRLPRRETICSLSMHHLLVWPVGWATRAGGLRGRGVRGACAGLSPATGAGGGSPALVRWEAGWAPQGSANSSGGHKTTAVFLASRAVPGRPFLPLEVSVLLHALNLGMHE